MLILASAEQLQLENYNYLKLFDLLAIFTLILSKPRPSEITINYTVFL